MTGAPQQDPLHVLREYRNLAPWNLRDPGGPPRGRSGRALSAWIARDAVRDSGEPSTWRRIPLGRGLELHVDAAHPLARVGPGDANLAEALRQVITKLLPHTPA